MTAEAERKILETFSAADRRQAEQINADSLRDRREIYGDDSPRLPHPYYVLDEDNVAVPVGVGTWAFWFERESPGRRRIAWDAWTDPTRGAVTVSTVFIGLDHSFGVGPRHLFETMVFLETPKDGPGDNACWRYATYAQAVAGHAHAVDRTRAYLAGHITADDLTGDDGPDDGNVA